MLVVVEIVEVVCDGRMIGGGWRVEDKTDASTFIDLESGAS